MLKPIRLVLTAGLLANVLVAQGALVDWDLTDVTFDDGATATGTFVLDTDLNQVTDFDISTTAGTTITTPFQYTPETARITLQSNEPGGSGWPQVFVQFDSLDDVIPGGNRELLLTFTSQLIPGPTPIAIAFSGGLGASSESELIGQHGGGTRLITGPEPRVVDPIPEPSEVGALAVGLAMMLGITGRRWRRRNN